MIGLLDAKSGWLLLLGILLVLVAASVITWVLSRWLTDPRHEDLLSNLKVRVAAWWAMCAVLAAVLAAGETAVVLMFLVLSLLALREFLTFSPTTRRDHRTLVWLVFIIPPLNYWFIWEHWYGAFSVLIPVYAFLFLPTRNAMVGETENFLQRSAAIQWALMVCVYAMSHIPALLQLPVAMQYGRDAVEGSAPGSGGAEGAHLLLFLLLVVQGSEVLQYVWGKLLGRHPIAPKVSPNKTWEGFIGGVSSVTLLGVALFWLVPFSFWEAGLPALVSSLLGFAGGLVMSAIKRNRSIKDFGTLISGHGGIMDRMDSLVFAAPVFFHLVRFFCT